MQVGIPPFLVASTTMRRTILDDPRYYLNRHVQWLDFNRRVLEEACDSGNPLLERVKFLAITANNLDEFVEVRVSSFLQRIEHGSAERSPDGLSTEEELALVTQAMHSLVRDQRQFFFRRKPVWAALRR